MGFDLYILHRGESIEELDRRKSADHFGLRTKTMVELERLAATAGVGGVAKGPEDPVVPQEAAMIVRKLRAFLADTAPGPDGSATDKEMREIAADFAGFCERAAKQGGYVAW